MGNDDMKAKVNEVHTETIDVLGTALLQLRLLKGEHPLVLICPGGGYFFCNPDEGVAIADAFGKADFSSAILWYSTAPEDHYPKQLTELAAAVDYLKGNVAFTGLFVCGFSAGGHLAASLGVLAPRQKLFEAYNIKVDGLLLCYAVTLDGPFGSKRTFDELCGDDEGLKKWNSLPDKVDGDCPPCFIWHTGEDQAVPVENALFMAAGLRKARVPFELHIYQKGPHALNLAAGNAQVATWFPLACAWIENTVADSKKRSHK